MQNRTFLRTTSLTLRLLDLSVSQTHSRCEIARDTIRSVSVKLFYSYSHKDEELRKELEKHLSILRRKGVIAEWHDRKIEAGVEWRTAIDDNLNNADVILLLISPDFLASD